MTGETANFIARDADNKHDMQKIKLGISRLPGVKGVDVNEVHGLVTVDYDSAGVSYDKIENCLNRLGYDIAADASNIQTR